jgi:hypothetical protein
MHNAADKASEVLAQPSASGEQTQPERCTDADAVAIWERMASVYGHKWTSQYGERVDPTWRQAFKSVPVDRLKKALARCVHRDDPWPPSLTEFMALTAVWPDEVGAPDYDSAFAEACRGSHPVSGRQHTWSHRSVYWAAVWTGMEPLRERPHKVRKTFDSKYQAAVEQYAELPDPPAAQIEHRKPEPGPEADAAAETALSEMRQLLP